tara:strand:+ start:219 stop:578 length:360 start_codon:yes stop_codon:yes gene_type:complete
MGMFLHVDVILKQRWYFLVNSALKKNGNMYRIKNLQKRKAKMLGVEIKPSKIKGKKIDVFKDGKKVASIGATGYKDYATYIETKGLTYADKRRKMYKARHQKDRTKKGTAGFYADQILW